MTTTEREEKSVGGGEMMTFMQTNMHHTVLFILHPNISIIKYIIARDIEIVRDLESGPDDTN